MSLLAGIQSLDELELENQRVFVRADLDAPMNKAGEFVDDSRIRAVVPTLKKLQELGARVTVASRFGETKTGPQGSTKRAELPSIEPAAARLSELMGCEVLLPDAATGESVKKVMGGLRSTQICVLENLARETDVGQGAEAFARQLVEYVDIYLADSLRALELDSASTVQLPKLADFRGVSTNLLRELQHVSRIRSGIDAPRLVIWGGNSLSHRLDVLDALTPPGTRVLFVGVAGNTMLRALGGALGRSAVEEDYLAGARTLADKLGSRMILPTDLVTATSPRAEQGEIREATKIREGEMALDLGPTSCAQIEEACAQSGTVIWCGNAGFHKNPAFEKGTRAILESLSKSPAFTMVAGEDSVAAAHTVGHDLVESIDCVTQGGTAALALFKETKLLGLEALRGVTPDE